MRITAQLPMPAESLVLLRSVPRSEPDARNYPGPVASSGLLSRASAFPLLGAERA